MDRSQSSDTSYSSFPKSPSEFDTDPRISFSKLDDKYILETDEGAEYEYDAALKRWIPVVGIMPPSSPRSRRCETAKHGCCFALLFL